MYYFLGNFLFLASVFVSIFFIFIIFAAIFSFIRAITLKNEIRKLSSEIKELKEKIKNLYSSEIPEFLQKEELEKNISYEQTFEEENNKNIFEDKEEIAQEETAEEIVQKLQNFETPQSLHVNKMSKNKTNKTDLFFKKAFVWLFGGNIVAKVAVLILFFGIAFLLKYSIDKGLLSPEVRILGSVILGFILIGLGFKLKQKNELFALILQGGGIGVLYMSIFAAAKLYPMLPIGFAFALLVALCAVSVVFALSQNALSLAIIAFLGAYLAPILLSDGSGNHKVLFAFYTLVSIGIVVVSKWRSWRSLNLLGFVFTFIVFYYWMFNSYHRHFYIETQMFVIANLIIFGFLSVVLFIRGEKEQKFTVFIDILMLFGTPLLSFLIQYEMTKQTEFAAAFSAVCFGLLYVFGTFITLKYNKERTLQVLYYGIGLALCFATIAIPLAFSKHLTSLIWMVEGSIISYISLKNKKINISFVGLGITAFGVLYAFKDSAIYNFVDFDFVMLFGAISAITLFNTCIFYHFKEFGKNLKEISFIILAVAAFFWVIWIFESVNRVMEENIISLLAFFTAAVWLWYFIGKKQNFIALKYAVISLWPVLAFVVFSDFTKYDKSQLLWQISWFFAFLSAYFYLYIEQKSIQIFGKLELILHVSLFWVVCAFIYNKSSSLLDANFYWGYGIVKHSILISIFSFIVLLVYFLRKKSLFPVNNFKNEYWTFGLFPVIFYITIRLLKGSTYRGDVPDVKFISFFNPLEESGIFAILVIVFYFFILYKIFENSVHVKKIHAFICAVPSALIFIFANSILIRFLSHTFNVPWISYYLWQNSIIQASLSIFWTLSAFGLLVFANKKSIRAVWFVGISLLVVVVIKLVFIDSVKLEGLIRAFAFIGVALLMLLIGYLTPIPPKKRNL